MSVWAVQREAGPTWREGGIYDQNGVSEHATFMKGLSDDGLIVVAGPVAGTENGRVRVLLIVDAESEAAIHRRLADDPWMPTAQILTVSTEPWKILVGAEQLSAAVAV